MSQGLNNPNRAVAHGCVATPIRQKRRVTTPEMRRRLARYPLYGHTVLTWFAVRALRGTIWYFCLV